MTLIAATLALWAALLVARGTPTGDMLHRWLVAAPARRLSRIARGHVFIMVALVVFVALVFWVFEAEGVRLLSMMSPEIMGVLATAEVATWVDVLVMGTLAASTTRLRQLLARMQGVARRPKRARRVARPARRPSANDDDGAAGYALAA